MMLLKKIVLMWLALTSMQIIVAQQAHVFVSSSIGNENNTGLTPTTAKKLLQPTLIASNINPLKVGCLANDVFNENFFSNKSIQLSSYYLPNTNKALLATFNGSTMYNTGWQKEVGYNNIYSITIQPQGYVGNGVNGIGQYSFIYVTEVNKQTALQQPYTSKKPLRFINNVAQADTMQGSYVEEITNGPIAKKIYVHTSNSASPNNNENYQYQIAVKDWAIYGFTIPNNRYEKLWVYGYGAGVGMLSSGTNAYYNRIIFGPGGGIHHLGVRGGSINKCVFLPASENVTEYAVVFYDTQGNYGRNSINNSLFLGIDKPLYTHAGSNSQIKFSSFSLNNVIAFSEKKGGGIAIAGNDVDSILVNRMYASNYGFIYTNSYPAYVGITNSVFLNTVYGIKCFNRSTICKVENTYIQTEHPNRGTGINSGDSTNLFVTNSIIHLQCGKLLANNSAFIINGTGKATNSCKIFRNIFILSADSTNTIPAGKARAANATFNNGDEWDYNVYVLLKGKGICWQMANTQGTNYVTLNTLEAWQTQTGQDAHSIYIDLRNDERGLKALFTDPDNGNFSLTNSTTAQLVKNISAGMLVPLQCYITKPTQEQAAAMVVNDNIVQINQCQLPCQLENISTFYTLAADTLPLKKIGIKWQLPNNAGILKLQLLRAVNNNNNWEVLEQIPVEETSFNYIDSNITAGIQYQYCVSLVMQNGNTCFSKKIALTLPATHFFTLYPNPNNGQHLFINTGKYSGKVNIDIINALGEKVYTATHQLMYLQPLRLLLQLNKGMYWVKISDNNTSSVQKLLVQ